MLITPIQAGAISAGAPPPAGGAVAPFSLPEPPQPTPLPAVPEAAALAGTFQPGSWNQLVNQLVREVDARQRTAGELARDVLAGGPTKPHEAVMALEEASISFQMLAEMRNKVVESYQEVMRMQV